MQNPADKTLVRLLQSEQACDQTTRTLGKRLQRAQEEALTEQARARQAYEQRPGDPRAAARYEFACHLVGRLGIAIANCQALLLGDDHAAQS